MSGTGTVVAVVVTYNRADLLPGMLAGLKSQSRPLDQVIVINNASTDHTAEVLAAFTGLPLQVITNETNTGGSGGFHLGMKLAHEQAYDWMWLMDDDVVPAADCLDTLLEHSGAASAMICVREDSQGRLVEKAALRFDLANPLQIRPKTASIESTYQHRAAMPTTVPVENVAFEGFLVNRRVVDEIGLPDPSYFIFYDDVDFAIRARRAGYRILAIRDAVLVRQLDFDQQHALDTWKGFYMYRNLFTVHFRYGENFLVRLKPYAIAAAVTLAAPIRGGRAEVKNVWKGLIAARSMRS